MNFQGLESAEGVWQCADVRFFLSIIFVLLVAAGCAKREQVAVVATAEEALAKGWENYRLSEFDRASRFFEQAINGAATNSETQLQARFALATTWNLRRPGEDRVRAEAMYREILSASPSRDLAAWTSLALARMKHLVPVGEEPKMGEVRAAYQKIVDDFPGHLAAKEAFIYKMATFIATLEAQQTRYAVACLAKYVSNPANKEFLQPAWSLMAVGHQTLREPEQRLAAEIRALQTMEIDPSNPNNELGWAYWNIATIAEFDCGNFAVARAYYNKLLKEYPTDIKVYGTKQALKRMDEVEARLRAEMPKPSPQNPKQIPSRKPSSSSKKSVGLILAPVGGGEERGEGAAASLASLPCIVPSPQPSPRRNGERVSASPASGEAA